MACGRHLRDHARSIAGKAQQFTIAYARALEVIPRQLCDNAGFDATDVLNKLRQKHALADGSGRNFGVDVNTGAVSTQSPFCSEYISMSPHPANCCVGLR
jgi:T-complex protein 1 subunit eta